MLRTTTLRKVLLIGLLTLLIASQAGTVSAGTNVSTSNGLEGGMVYAMAIDPVTPTTLYVGTNDRGIVVIRQLEYQHLPLVVRGQ